MFAYCENSPCLGFDSTGTYRVLQEDFDEDVVYHEVINGQGREPYASMRIGTSDFEHSACGAIAVHNALVLSGYSSDIREWVCFFESRCYFRRLGVMPWEIDNALDAAGVSYEESEDYLIAERCKNGGVVVLTYWNKVTLVSEPATYFRGPVYGYFRDISKGAHTIAVTYHDNQYWVYNSWNGAKEAWGTTSLDYCTKRGAFIYGFYIYPNS